MAHHVFARAKWIASISGDLLAYLKSTYSPLVLLGFDEESGTTAVDSSGNGNDFTWNGSPTLGVAGPFANAGLAAQTAVGAYASLASGPSTGTARTIITAVKFDRTPASSDALFDARASATAGQRTLFYFVAGELYLFDGFNRPTGRDYANVMGVLIGATIDGASINVYENGLPFKAITGVSGSLSTPTYAVGAFFDGSQTQQHDHQLSMVVGSTLTAAQMHDIAVQVGAAPAEGHWYYTDVVANGLDAFCVFHAPLWEEAGSQAIDVSGNENHGTYTSGPTLGQTALGTSSGAVYSVATTGTSFIQALSVGDVFAVPWACSFTFVLNTITTNHGIWTVGTDSTNRTNIYVEATGRMTFQCFDGTTNNLIQSSTGLIVAGQTHQITIRGDGASGFEVWVDGTSVGSVDASTHTKANSGNFIFGKSAVFVGSENHQLPAIFNAALPDDWCAFLAGASAPTTLDASSRVRWTMDETDGTALDSALNNDATYAGNPVYNGGSTTFDGSGDYLETDGQTVSLGGDCTFIMEGSSFASGGVFFVCENPTASQSYTLYGNGTTLSVFDGSVRSTGYTLTGSENDFAMVVSGTSCTVYVDGVATPSSPFTVNTRDLSASYIRLMSNRAGGQQISGTVEHFEAFDKAMSAAEIAAEHARR